MVRVGRARTFGSGGTFFQATIGPRRRVQLPPRAARGAVRSAQHPRALRRRPGVLGAGAVSRTQGVDAAQRVVSRRALAPPDRALLPLGVSSRRRRHRGLRGDARSRCGATPTSSRPSSRTASTWRYWRVGARAPSTLRPGMRNLVYLGRLEERNGPEVAIDAFNRIAPVDAGRAAADGGRRADARRAGGAGPAGAARPRRIHSARSTTSVRSCSRRRRCSCCRRGRSASPSWCWRPSRPACPSWRCPASGPIGPAITGRT